MSNLYHHKKKHANESCAAKIAIKQESKNSSLQGIYEHGYLHQQSYATEDMNSSMENVSSQSLSHLDSPNDHLDPRGDVMDTKTREDAHVYHDPSYLSNFSQYYSAAQGSSYPHTQSPVSGHSINSNSKLQNSYEQYMDTSPDQYR